MSDATILVSLSIFIVYMQRKGRWETFFAAMSGAASVKPT